MRIRFLADSDLNHDIVKAIMRREPSVDFLSAFQAGLQGLADHQVLAIAADDGRILVSHDNRTMPRHFADFISLRPSSGLLIVSQKLAVAEVVEELLLIWSASEPDEWLNRLSWLPL